MALTIVSQGLADIPEGSLTGDQKNLRQGVCDFLTASFYDPELLNPQPTNAKLAEKYAVSRRTITNWRKAGCPFGKGQWRVLDWIIERRIIPPSVKEKFARQFDRRTEREVVGLYKQFADLAERIGSLIWLTDFWQ